jgi:hypothetical protein
MKAVCEALDVPSLGRNLARQLRRTAVGFDMRDFAGHFVMLQDARHEADYDPAATFSQVNVEQLVNSAELAIATFDRTDLEEQADVLALMLTGPRA